MILRDFFTRDSLSNSDWYFPRGRDLEKASASDADIETFQNTKIESLAREICQNSLDAAADAKKPVKVTFKLMDLDTNEIPGRNQFLKQWIPSAEKTWPREENTKRLLANMKSQLEASKVSVLKISDFNTTGLEQSNWESLIEQAGSSVKKNDNSAGSFGIGKAAPFAVSQLRMVLYSTLTSSKKPQSIGVVKFVSCDLQYGETTQKTGYFGDPKKTPFAHSVAFDSITREQPGTDIYIIGFDQADTPDWQDKMIHTILDNFLLSLKEHKLEVEVDGQLVNSENNHDYIMAMQADKRLAKKYLNLISYEQVWSDPDHKEIPIPGFPELDIKTGEGMLLLSNQTANNRRVLMTRQVGMKIFDQSGISGILKFSGICQFSGSNANRFLKQLEDPNHSKWYTDRADNKRQAKAFLDHIKHFIKDQVQVNYGTKIADRVDAFGVEAFLPYTPNTPKLPAKSGHPDGTAGNQVKITLKIPKQQRTDHTVVRAEETGDVSEPKLAPSSVEPGDSAGVGFDGSKPADKNSSGIGGQPHGGGDAPGENSNESGKGKIQAPQPDKVKAVTDLTYRVIERQANQGKYRIVVNPSSNLTGCLLKVFVIGDSAKKIKVNVISAQNNDGEDLVTLRNTIALPQLKRKIWQGVNVTIGLKDRLKLEVAAYANSK